MEYGIIPFSEGVENVGEAYRRLVDLMEQYDLYPSQTRLDICTELVGADEDQDRWEEDGMPDSDQIVPAFAFKIDLNEADIEDLIDRGLREGKRLIQAIIPGLYLLFLDNPRCAEAFATSGIDARTCLGSHDGVEPPLLPSLVRG